MKTSIENLDGHFKNLTVILAPETVTEKTEDYFKSLKNKVEIKGFRKGKAPMKVIKAQYGDSVKDEIVKELVEDNLPKALKENNLNPAHMPNIETTPMKENQEFKFNAKFENLPEIKLVDLKGLSLTAKDATPTEDEVNSTIKNITKRHRTYEEITNESHIIEATNSVNLNYLITCPEEKDFKEIKADDSKLELSNENLLPDFVKNIVGLKKGDKKEFVIDFPKGTDEKTITEFSGKKLNYSIEVLKIEKCIDPSIDDPEFLKKIGFNEKELFLEKVKESIVNQKKSEFQSFYQEEASKWLLKNHQFDAPKTMVDEQVKNLTYDYGMKLTQSGINPEEIENKIKEETSNINDLAAKQVKTALMLREISSAQNIQATEEEVRQEISQMAMQSGKKPEDLLKDLREKRLLLSVFTQVAERKALKWLVDLALDSNENEKQNTKPTNTES